MATAKEATTRRLLDALYPRRRGVVFMVDPDHNPLVLQDCPGCAGRGQRCLETSNSATLAECSQCQGAGTTWSVERYFLSDTFNPRAATPSDHWVDCPWCGRRFSLRDDAAWSGLRHLKCGGIVMPQDISQPTTRRDWQLCAAGIWRDGGSSSATLERASQRVSLWLQIDRSDGIVSRKYGPLFVSNGPDPSIKQARVPPRGEAAWRAALSQAIACSTEPPENTRAIELVTLLAQREVERPGQIDTL